MRLNLEGLVDEIKVKWFVVFNSISVNSAGTGMGDNWGDAELRCFSYSGSDELISFVNRRDINTLRIFKAGKELGDEEITLLKTLSEED